MNLSAAYRLALVIAAAAVVTPAQARTHRCAKKPTYAQQLQGLGRRIDDDTGRLPREPHIEALAEDYHVPITAIEDLRAKGKGWGDITLRLSFAEALSAKDRAHFDTVSDALDEINRRSLAPGAALAKEYRLNRNHILDRSERSRAAMARLNPSVAKNLPN
ncbi:MAG TPA: hypothetical protein VMU17_01915 [Elusimicrobiota bacterium]|nr:hypothetical protein [Elusimicrobiota bacterium]